MTPRQLDVFERVLRFITRRCRGVSIEDLGGPSRVAPVVRARHLLISLLRAEAAMTMRQIALLLNRDTSAIAHALQSLRDRAETDARFREELEEMARAFSAKSETRHPSEDRRRKLFSAFQLFSLSAFLLAGCAQPPSLPTERDTRHPAPVTRSRPARAYYLAVTASNVFGVSDYSAEVTYTGNSNRVTLAWDPSACGTAAGYQVHWGGAARDYTNSLDAGTNLVATVALRSLPTNRVVTARVVSASSLAGPWTADAQWSAVSWTNPAAPQRWYRLVLEERWE
jgi:hypothetical protein